MRASNDAIVPVGKPPGGVGFTSLGIEQEGAEKREDCSRGGDTVDVFGPRSFERGYFISGTIKSSLELSLQPLCSPLPTPICQLPLRPETCAA